MSKFIWKLKSPLYHYFRLNPISAFFLNGENEGIKSLLKKANNIQLETALDMGCGRGNSLLLMPKSVINVIAFHKFEYREKNPL